MHKQNDDGFVVWAPEEKSTGAVGWVSMAMKLRRKNFYALLLCPGKYCHSCHYDCWHRLVQNPRDMSLQDVQIRTAALPAQPSTYPALLPLPIISFNQDWCNSLKRSSTVEWWTWGCIGSSASVPGSAMDLLYVIYRIRSMASYPNFTCCFSL